MAEKNIVFTGNATLPAIGQGTWYMGENSRMRAKEVDALRAGIDLGLTLIDTAEMYAEGGAEEVVGEALQGGLRDKAFLVSKVYPWNAAGKKAIAACEASLRRLKTDVLDLYLLHWRGNYSLAETVEVMETLMQQGKIRRWGVSNLDYSDMQELSRVSGGKACAADQVLYHLGSRGIEFDLLPWCQQQAMPVMAYCPLAQAGRLRDGLLESRVVQDIAHAHRASAAQILLAWVISHQGVMAIPKAASVAHVEENAAALKIVLSADDLARLDNAFPAPNRKTPLDVV
ncbi:UNVERIFIED_ORG: diketogulonate reductase-like aldo/keto reductase [Kosakonia oryzae]|uniref:Aldo/keto reductase n=1 Tax=Kosakonia radicincitans TaxID=283686 RepID=A0AAX2EW04_9ENTR|nr:aldo/keto reductase [Kosakonia radicincitans]MDP9568827.1 diketogulonate reductase-like aldo/keto reductase [Kosakonia oryzae]SFF14975.1 Aldo/keto reductase [Kosakonia radicincitans]SFR22044.1 Aldo/keto reductase [Kosakonia radicincitans]SFT98626.1 Aldo/keto reductase [Kosakonia radicincitans]SFY13953.1 Aldo/keto reductase [Kosakonia radicincitans]